MLEQNTFHDLQSFERRHAILSACLDLDRVVGLWAVELTRSELRVLEPSDIAPRVY